MASSYPTFVVGEQSEVFGSDATTSASIRRAVQVGRARRIARGVFTRNTNEPIERVVARNWAAIAAIYVPHGVVVDRSGFDAKPSDDGSLMLDGGPVLKGRRAHELPGLRLRVRPGPGPLPGDMPYLGGLYFSSHARKWLDNMASSRVRSGVSRTLSPAELERELNRMVALRGWDAINELRDQARELAPQMNAEGAFGALDDLIGALQGTRDGHLTTPGGKAAGMGRAFDPQRVELFGRLHSALLVEPLPRRGEQPDSLPALSFIEAYFSNWIEGTEFELHEAEAIVFERAIPANRVEDAHDVLGTFELVNDDVRRRQVPESADEFIDLLRKRHGQVLERRPQARPGEFKEIANRAGSTTFVHPDLVLGTLREGYRYVDSLPDGLARAIFFKFLIAEVHPFTDGNGRIARIFMNAELTTVGQQRIVIPLVYRDNYLQALRALTHNREPGPLVRVLDYAQRYAAAIPWQTLDGAEVVLRATNAFITPDQAAETGARLRIPVLSETQPAEAPPMRPATQESPEQWAAEHHDDLQLIWDRFNTSGEWPEAKLLARELFGAGRDLDINTFARTIPPRLGRLDTQSGRLLLTPRGLSFVDDAQPLLSNIPKLLHTAIERYGNPDVEPVISSSEFGQLLWISHLAARQLAELLLLDGWLFRAAGDDDDGWQRFQIDESAILRVRNARSLKDYFAAQDGT